MRVAILGAAHQHVGGIVRSMLQHEDVEILGVWEPDPALRARYLDGLSLPVAPSVDALLAQTPVDAAIIGGVYSTRAACAEAALRAGAHVLADKPLATDLDQLTALERVAETGSAHVSVLFEKRFAPVTVALRSLLERGILGSIAMISSTAPHKLTPASRPAWFFDPALYGGIAGDLPIHDIDLVLELTGAQEGTVSALTGSASDAGGPQFHDHASLLLHAGSTPAIIEASWLGPEASDVHGHYRMQITGTEGTAVLDWAYETLTVTTHGSATWEEPPRAEHAWPGQYFFRAIARGEEPAITTEQSLRATRAALAAQASAEASGALLHW